MEKPWGGAFEKETEASVERFTESISFDKRLYREDIRVSIAHAEMLCHCGLISEGELLQIREALREIEREIESGTFQFRVELEDVHMNIDAELIRRLGETGRKLHTARSRNDQVAADLRLWVCAGIDELDGLAAACQRALVSSAEQFDEIIIPGLTHLQHAQPVLLAHALLAYAEMLGRDRERLQDCRKRAGVSPLGACALAGTSLPIDVRVTAEKLGFDSVFSNSMDAVSDRDFVVEFAFDLALVACHLSRLAEEWLLWATSEFDFVDLDESYCTGSSIMPQKKNPDVLELVRAKTGRIYGHLIGLLTVLKGLPSTYNRDLQEDKEAVFDAADQVRQCLSIMSELIERTTFKEESIRNACDRGYLDATALAEYLVGRGLPFREAHHTAGEIVKHAAVQNVSLRQMSLHELRAFNKLIDEDVFSRLGCRNCVENYRSHGSSSPAEVQRQIRQWKEALDMG